MEPLVTIGITSYKRLEELKRCLRSIITSYNDEIEVIVSEDRSPLSKEIGIAVNDYTSQADYPVYFMPNEVNLGYDMNLGSIIKKANGEYIFFMSDDDVVCEGFLDKLIPFLKKNNDYGVLYAPFVYSNSNKKDRWHGYEHEINPGEASASKYIYDSILFSGLIFKREYVLDFDASRFKNHNYFQVYLFLKTINKFKGYYFGEPSVMCVSDGENAYGISESSGGNELLADRTKAMSILEFNKKLFDVIKVFDKEENTQVFTNFEKQYSLRAYSPMSLARMQGLEYFSEYWKMLNSLDIHLYPIVKAYHVILFVFGKKGADSFMNIFRGIVKKE